MQRTLFPTLIFFYANAKNANNDKIIEARRKIKSQIDFKNYLQTKELPWDLKNRLEMNESKEIIQKEFPWFKQN